MACCDKEKKFFAIIKKIYKMTWNAAKNTCQNVLTQTFLGLDSEEPIEASKNTILTLVSILKSLIVSRNSRQCDIKGQSGKVTDRFQI